MTSTPHVELDSQAPDTVDGRQIRAVAFQDVRLQYVAGTIEKAGLVAAGSRALVVGSGRGLLAGGLARMGFDVVAVDPSATATAMAREAHERQGLAVVHQTAPAEDLGLQDESFHIAYYADTLEITPDPDRVIEQAARVLKPDAVLIYDTVNRTLLSRLIYLGAFEVLPITRDHAAGAVRGGAAADPGRSGGAAGPPWLAQPGHLRLQAHGRAQPHQGHPRTSARPDHRRGDPADRRLHPHPARPPGRHLPWVRL
jgi:SAM-dependent methyltransferase